MSEPACSAKDFAYLFETFGGTEAAKRLGVTERNIYLRRKTVERELGRPLRPPTQHQPERDARLKREIQDGVILVGSDAHYWPDIVTTAHRAFVKFCSTLKPRIVVMNGDVFDGASISRHAPIGWEDRPTVIQEIEVCQERLGDIEKAAPKAEKIWPLGNHDARFETRLAQQAPEYARVHGMHLKDFFPLWNPCWQIHINGSDVVICHRFKGGTHATYNNTKDAGVNFVTGHLHSLKVTPFSDYRGSSRWGVDSGMLADPHGPQFLNYLEAKTPDWRSGFVVLTFKAGKLLPPEIVQVWGENEVTWRGEVISV